MDKNLKELLNQQINKELYSAYLYLSMASYFDSINLEGFSHWMKVQVKEEFSHAMKFYEFLFDRGEKVILERIEKPTSDFSSVSDVFEKILAHEKKITESIEKIYEMAQKVEDKATIVFIQWFISEQIEEEKTAQRILEKLKMIKEHPHGILMLDAQMAKRE